MSGAGPRGGGVSGDTFPGVSRTYTVIVNPASGRGRMLKQLPAISQALDAAGIDATVKVSESPEHPRELAAQAVDAGHVVVACGGDGLVGLVAGCVSELGGTLGIIPAGSGNDFARTLGFDPKDPVAAVDTLVTGVARHVDLGRADGRLFCCVASTGFDAEANRWANSVTRLKGTSLYIAAMLRTLATYRPRSFALTVDGERHELEGWLVAVGNATSYGGGMQVCPGARVDDGLLNCTVVGPVSRLAFLRTFPSVFKGTHVDHPEVHTFTGARVHIEALDGAPSPVYADGESYGDLPVDLEIVPGALEVIVPEDNPGT